jgi:hypothetical protein
MIKEKIKKRGRPSKADIKKKERSENIKSFIWIFSIFLFVLILAIFALKTEADQLTFKFGNPSFSKIGQSAHYLTIENQEHMRKLTIKEELKLLQEQIERDKENTTLARFLRSLSSRIYAQIARQIVENMFGETQSTSGSFDLEGNSISYSIEDGMITLTIIQEDGTETIIQLPIGDFSF